MGELTKNDDQRATGDRVLALIRTKHPEYHPLLAIAELAHSTEDDRIALECHKTIVKYVTPELKSIEVKADIRETRRVIVSMFDGNELEPMPQRPALDVSEQPILAEKPDPLWMTLSTLEAEEVAA